ncbi:MAG: extracellular solute-binding protein [Acholeplasmatales bacterium]
MKKIFTIIVLMLGFYGLTGCINPEQTESENGEIYVDKEWAMYEKGHTVDKPVTIDFWSANSLSDIQGQAMANLVEEFNQMQREQYPDSAITVTPSFNGGYIVQNTKLQSAIPANTNPEIAMVGVSSFSLYHQNVIDMREVFTYDEIRDIFPGFLQFAMYRHVFVAYPYFAASNILALNRTLLAKTGKHIPTVDEIVSDPENSIWTWEYLEEVLRAVRNLEGAKENNIYGLATTGIPIYESFFSRGEAPYNEGATEIAFTKKTATEIFDYWQRMARDGLYENPVLDPQHANQIKGKYISGFVGMNIVSSSTVLDLINSIPKDPNTGEPIFEADVLPHPKDKYFYSNQSGGGLILFKNKSELRRKAAVEFMRWLYAPEQAVKYSTNAGYLITTNAARNSAEWQAFTSNVNPLMDEVIKFMHFAPQAGLRLPIGRSKAQADTEFANYSKGIYYENCTVPPADVVDEVIKRVNYILDVNKE